MVEKEINIILKATDKATSEINKLGSSLSDFAEKNRATFSKMALIGTAAFGGIIGIAKKSIDAYAGSEAQLARTDQAIRNIDLSKMNTSFGEASKKAREFGTGLQKLAGISDEEGAESFAKLLAITKDYPKAQKMATLAADLSVAKQIDLGSATKIVSMAMAGNTRILKEYGIELNEGATQQEIMGAIMEKVGGQSEAFGKTTAGQMAILKETTGDLTESVGQALIPAFQNLLDVITPMISKFQAWASENPEMIKKIVLVGLAIAGLVAVFGTIGLVLPTIIIGVNALGVAFMFLAANPIGLIITAIGLLIIGGVRLYNHWELVKTKAAELGEKFLELYDKYQTIIIGVFALGAAFMFLAANPIGLIITAIGLLITGGVRLYNNWELVKTKAVELGEKFLELYDKYQILFIIFLPLIALGVELYRNWDIISLKASELWEKLKVIWTNISTFMTTTITSIKTVVSGIWNSMLDGMKNAVVSVFDWIVEKFDWIVNTVTRAVAKLKSLWASVTGGGGSVGGGVVGGGGRVRALGGTVRANSSYLVGERGPEMFTPASTGSITPNNQMGGKTSININMGGVTVNNSADENRLVDKISDMLKRQTQLYQLGIN